MNKKTLMSVGRTAAMGSMLLFGGAFIAGCGDETTEVTEKLGLAVVEEGEEMPECTADNEGDMIYVKDEKVTYACEDEEWVSLKGEAGENGTSCTAKQLKDKSGYEITCGGEKIGTIKNGEKGEEGEAGASCSAKELKDGSGYELTCNGKKVGTIKNGDDGEEGAAGTSCTGAANEDGSVTITCDGKVVGTIKNGTDGKSAYELAKEADPTIGSVTDWLASLKGAAGTNCSATKVADGAEIKCGSAAPIKITDGDEGLGCTSTDKDGVVTIKCGDDKVGVSFYKELCGYGEDLIPYDPQTQFCYYSQKEDKWVVSNKCNGQEYNINADVCEDNVLKKYCYTYDKYGEEEVPVYYDPKTEFCYNYDEDDEYAYTVYKLCNGEEYDYATQFCYRDEKNKIEAIGERCGTEQDYNPTEKFCGSDKKLHLLCNGEEYDVYDEFCYTDKETKVETVGEICSDVEDGDKYDPNLKFCGSKGDANVLLDFCGGKKYDADKEFCYKKEETSVGVVGVICGTSSDYDPNESFCDNGTVRAIEATCGNTKYDRREQLCDGRVPGGRLYNITKIYAENGAYLGTWMAENLNYATATESYCYGDLDANCEKYGRLYSFAAANTSGLCPTGWKIPSNTEVALLEVTFETKGAYFIAKTGWEDVNVLDYTDARWESRVNYTGLSMIHTGYRGSNGTYNNDSFKNYTAFWTSDDEDETTAFAFVLFGQPGTDYEEGKPIALSSEPIRTEDEFMFYANVRRMSKAAAYPVRCVLDE